MGGDITLKADPECPNCRGTGTVYDSVPYGSTTTLMPSTCECVYEHATDEQMERIENGETFDIIEARE